MASARPRVLVIDDGERYARVVLDRLPELELVRPAGALAIPDGPAALAFLEADSRRVDVVLLDVRFELPAERLLPLAGADLRRTRRFQGLAILGELRRRHPELPVVLLTAAADLATYDAGPGLAAEPLTYLLEGEDLDTLRVRIHTALQARAPEEEDGLLWGSAPAVQAARRRLALLARGTTPVILEGETGTGKSLIAERFVHRRSGRTGPFVAVDLSTVPAELAPALLFGAVRGAYTGAVVDRAGVFEAARGGTLLLDEVQNSSPALQRQLLSVLQERRVRPLGSTHELPVDVKVIAASNVPLAEEVLAGRFRADLLMRLSPATRVTLPPLRERRGDLPFLARSFARSAALEPEAEALRTRLFAGAGLPADTAVTLAIGKERGAPSALQLSLPEPAWRLLAAHSWPGNVRELETVLRNAVLMTLLSAAEAARGGVGLRSRRLQIDPGLIGTLLEASAGLAPAPAGGSGAGLPVRLQPGASLNAVAASVERQYFTALFHRTGGSFPEMARLLLGDPGRGRAVRLRFNQLGLKARSLRPG